MQIPFQDDASLVGVEKFMANHTFDELLYLGDFLDFDVISHFNKDSPRKKEKARLAKDYAIANKILDRHQKIIRKNNPKAKFTLLEGNHDWRIERYINEHPELEGLLEVEVGLKLKERKFNWVRCWEDGEIYKIGKAYFTHGLYTNQYHAAKMVNAFGTNIYYGHCVSEDTEVLTKNGWIGYNKIKEKETEIATLNQKTKKMEWNVVKKLFIRKQYQNNLHLKSNHVDLIATDYHGMIGLRSGKKSYELFPLKDFGKKAQRILMHAGVMQRTGVNFSNDDLRLIIWASADGSLRKDGYLAFGIKKERKTKRLRSVLDSLNIKYSDVFRSGEQWIGFNIKKVRPEIFKLLFSTGKKHLPPELRNCNKEQAEVIIKEYGLTDGHIRGNSIRVYSAKESEMDLLQEIAVTNGFRASKYVQHNEKWNSSHSSIYILNVNPRTTSTIRVGNLKLNNTNYNKTVWCVSVDNGTVLFRRNGKTVITQNTHDIQFFPKVLRGKDKTIEGGSLGCLCEYDLSYIKGRPSNWQQAVSVMYVLPNGFYNLYTMKIFNHSFTGIDGQIYQP